MCNNTVFLNHVAAGHPFLWVQTHEEYRAMTEFSKEMEKAREKYSIYSWDRVDAVKERVIKDGILSTANVDVEGLDDFMMVLQWASSTKGMGNNSILFLLDYHHYIKKDMISRKIRNLIPIFKANGKVLVIITHSMDIPVELEKEVAVIPFTLPDDEALKITLKSVCESAETDYPENDKALIDAALGMTAFEAENAFSLSLIEKKCFDPKLVRREKAAIVKKTQLLEVIETREDINNIGGLNNLKEWLKARENCFTKKASEFGITPPKGILLVGVPGTGKSLSAKVIATVFQRALLRLDMGKVYGSYVGESEGNIRKCLEIAEAVAPCYLWIDELEKSFSGTKGAEGHETSKRVFSTFLTWLQEKTSDVFIVATANNVHALPPELLRSGRFDTIFWVDVPATNKEREEILQIQLNKVGHGKDKLDFNALAKTCEGLTGAEIEVWVKEALVNAFQNSRELTNGDFMEVLKEITPISVLMKEDIEESREWAQKRGVKYASINDNSDTPVFISEKKRKLSIN